MIDAATSRKLLAEVESALVELRNDRRVNAVLIYETIAKRSDLDALVQFALGRLSLALGGSFQAVEHFQAALSGDPDNAQYLGYLGLALQAENRYQPAIEAYERALLTDAGNFVVLNGLGSIYLERGDLEKARDLLARAVELKPGDAVFRNNYAAALANSNEHDAALKHAEKALRLDPNNLNAHNTYGRILAELGRVGDAVKHLEKTVRHHRHCGGAYDQLARLKKFSANDNAFMLKAEKVLQIGMPAKDRYSIHFALGKMYDDCQEFDKSFEHYRQGNLLKKKEYDVKKSIRTFEQIKKLFNADTLPRYQELGNSSTIPVFVVGMPRSGTTLMERMITSAERTAGAGELLEISRISEELAPSEDPRQFAKAAKANLTAENISKHAEGYLHILRQAGADAIRIVDKMPGNYYFIWMISILFPQATIIFARRHPLDVCLSCYFQNFASLRWANDLQTIADVYRSHREVMDYWKSVLPQGKIIEIEYELLVDEPEVHGRYMLESCGLEWRGDGLARYKKDQVVKTASLWQVRQPIYQSSKMRWTKYAPHLKELALQLSDYLQDDREQLASFGIDLPAPSRIGRLKRLFG